MKPVARITESLLADNVISEDERSIVIYGLENLAGNVICLLIMLVVGSFFGRFTDSFFVWLLTFPLRKYAGGFHAKTKGRCFIISVGMIFVSYFIFFHYRWKIMEILWIVLIFSLAIFVLAPVGSRNKPLDQLERKVYRKKARGFLLLEEMILCLALYFQWGRVVTVIAISVFMVGISLLAGKVIGISGIKSSDAA